MAAISVVADLGVRKFGSPNFAGAAVNRLYRPESFTGVVGTRSHLTHVVALRKCRVGRCSQTCPIETGKSLWLAADLSLWALGLLDFGVWVGMTRR